MMRCLVDKHLDATIAGREHHRIVQQDLNGLCQHIVVEWNHQIGSQGEEGELQALAFRSLELRTLLLHELLQVARLLVQRADLPFRLLWLHRFLRLFW